MSSLSYSTIEDLAVQAILKPTPDPDDRALIAEAIAAIAKMRNCSQDYDSSPYIHGATPDDYTHSHD